MKTNPWFIRVFLLPAFLFFTCFAALPGIRALFYSLQKWDGLTTPEWVGLDNFRTLFADDLFIKALTNNVILMVGAGSITLILALFFASALHRQFRGAGIFRIAFFFPNILAAVAVALLWMLLYSVTEFGVFNGILRSLDHYGVKKFMEAIAITVGGWFGLELSPIELPFAFTDSKILIYAVIPMVVWTATGFYMILFLAAMQSIPEELYEASHLDGASHGQQFFHITLPLIREVFIVGVVFFIISSAKFFDAIWVLESQYPTPDSHVLATVLYQKVFTEYNVGYAAAVAVVLFGLVMVATLVTLNLSRKEALEY
jgi:ABC-type sugar transport system permease subunit